MNKKRKSPLQLHLDDETENLFRQIAEKEVRDLSGQFKIIFREWLAFKSAKRHPTHQFQTDIEAARVGGSEELGNEALEEMGGKLDTSKPPARRHPR